MPQLSYPFLMDVGSVGLLADSGFKNVLSPIAFENFNVGLGLAKVIGQDYVVRLPQSNLSTTVISADLITANVINPSSPFSQRSHANSSLHLESNDYFMTSENRGG